IAQHSAKHVLHAGNHPVHGQNLGFRHLLFREGEQLLNKRDSTFGGAMNLLAVPTKRAIGCQSGEQKVGVQRDRGEHIIKFARHALFPSMELGSLPENEISGLSFAFLVKCNFGTSRHLASTFETPRPMTVAPHSQPMLYLILFLFWK